ncbi:MAG: hypothetical protein Q4D16_00475 [Eubacteriales bacterium]|nr:hypothetical protein [Eubacteriales bacterium]
MIKNLYALREEYINYSSSGDGHNTEEKNYMDFFRVIHGGFVLFLVLYSFIESLISLRMGMLPEITSPYNMSGLLVTAMDVFMAYVIGFMEGVFLLYAAQKGKRIMRIYIRCFISLLIIYSLGCELFRLSILFYRVELWRPVWGSIRMGFLLSCKEAVFIITGSSLGKVFYRIRQRMKNSLKNQMSI